MTTFEKIFIEYGGYILICVRNVLEESEDYERCTEINKVLKKHSFPTNMTLNDYKIEMQKKGSAGQQALSAAPYHFIDALELCKKDGLLDKCIQFFK